MSSFRMSKFYQNVHIMTKSHFMKELEALGECRPPPSGAVVGACAKTNIYFSTSLFSSKKCKRMTFKVHLKVTLAPADYFLCQKLCLCLITGP